jgi:hypothetical protein
VLSGFYTGKSKNLEVVVRWLLSVLLLAALSAAQIAPSSTSLADARDKGDEPDVRKPGEPKTVVVPARTKVPLALKQTISTKTARQGDPVYAETNFPISIDGKMLIPAGTYVQGVIDQVRRGGRLKGKAELLMHFTTLIYPNGYTVMMPGALENVPGAQHEKIKGEEGKIQEEGQTGQKVGTAASTAATGAVIGGLSQGGKGAAIGAGVGGVAGLAIAMLTRGNDVRLEPGTGIQMVIQRPLTLEAARISPPAK